MAAAAATAAAPAAAAGAAAGVAAGSLRHVRQLRQQRATAEQMANVSSP